MTRSTEPRRLPYPGSKSNPAHLRQHLTMSNKHNQSHIIATPYDTEVIYISPYLRFLVDVTDRVDYFSITHVNNVSKTDYWSL